MIMIRNLSNGFLISCVLNECISWVDDPVENERGEEIPETENTVMILRTTGVSNEDLVRTVEARPINVSYINQMENLSLSYLGLESMHDGTFEHFNNLSVLDLSNNELKSISSKAFSNLSLLESMSIDNNKLSFIDEQLFDALESLKSLSLTSNELTRLTRRTFSKLKNLDWLNLSDNMLSFQENGCPRDLFWDLGNLTELNLYNNNF